MGLTINVTWPEDLHFCVPTGCSDMRIISERKATRNGSHIEIDGAFGRINRVCDDDIYRINCRSRSPLECCQPGAPHEQTLVILLESPHKYEYRLNCIDRPIAPAQGTTGRNIRDHLVGIVRNCQHISSNLDGETRIILANPIQRQTSLASIIRISRKSGENKKEKRRRIEKGKKFGMMFGAHFGAMTRFRKSSETDWIAIDPISSLTPAPTM